MCYGAHHRDILASRALVSAQQWQSAGIALRAAVLQHFAQGTGILKAHVHSLTRKRVEIMRGVSHQRKAGTNQAPHPDAAQRKARRRSEERRVGKECRSRWWA